MILTITVPAVAEPYYDAATGEQIKRVLTDELGTRYDKLLTATAARSHVPAKLLRSVIFIESRGDAGIVSSGGAVGLMQVTPDTAAGTLHLEAKKGRLTPAERAIAVESIGEAGMRALENAANLNVVANLRHHPVTVEMLKNPEFNVLCGAILLGQLIDQETDNGVVNIAAVIVRYGRGMFTRVPDGLVTAQGVYNWTKAKRGWGEVRAALAKYLGPNGLLDLHAQLNLA